MLAFCKTIYAQLRPEPGNASELISQLVFGELVLVLENDHEWCKIETEHGYQGFTRFAQLIFVESETAISLLESGLEIFGTENSNATFVLNEMKLQPGCFTYPGNFESKFYGRIAKNISNPPLFAPSAFAKYAAHFLGIPYVWGGNTFSGLDCSGLVQSIFHQMGFSFPRDAWQQAEIGNAIDFEKNDPEFEPGDLLYFQREGKKIHHVAISCGGKQYFHASEWTRFNSLSVNDETFVKDRFETLVSARRITNMDLTPLLESFKLLLDRDI